MCYSLTFLNYYRYNRKAPLCTKPQETAWLFHEIGNCFLMMRIFEYAHESGLKALKAANDANSKRLQMQTNVLTGVAEGMSIVYVTPHMGSLI